MQAGSRRFQAVNRFRSLARGQRDAESFRAAALFIRRTPTNGPAAESTVISRLVVENTHCRIQTES